MDARDPSRRGSSPPPCWPSCFSSFLFEVWTRWIVSGWCGRAQPCCSCCRPSPTSVPAAADVTRGSIRCSSSRHSSASSTASVRSRRTTGRCFHGGTCRARRRYSSDGGSGTTCRRPVISLCWRAWASSSVLRSGLCVCSTRYPLFAGPSRIAGFA